MNNNFIKITKITIAFVAITILFSPTYSAFAANVTVDNNSYGMASNTNAKVYLNSTDTHPNGNPVKIDNLTGNFSGWAWSEDLGWIDFNGVKLNLNHKVSGIATITNTNQKIYFDTSTYNANVEINDNGQFNGYAWSEDIGWINFANARIGTSFPLTHKPSQPTNLQATIPSTLATGQVKLTWNTPTDNGNSPITDYIIEYQAAGTSTWSTFNDGTSTNTNSVVTGLDSSKQYNFRVKAVNTVGQSNPSNVATIKPAYLTISIDNNNLNFNLIPNPTIQKHLTHNISISTNYQSGYSLYLSTKDNTSNSQQLIHNTIPTNTINPISTTTPTQLINNSWGFRLNNYSSMYGQNTDYTTKKYLPVPTKNNPNLLKTVNRATDNNQTELEYSIKVGLSQPSGDYQQTIIYTVVTNL